MSKFAQGKLVELDITDLNSSGAGVARLDGHVIFVPNTVTGDRVLVRLLRTKPQYSYGKLEEILQPSPQRIRPQCIVADKCGGCQWQHIAEEYQQVAKRKIVIDALQKIGGFSQLEILPILASISSLAYRNKATYPLAISATGKVQAGYYRQGSHQLVNLNQCPIQDSRLNPLLAEVKQDIQEQGWSIYNEQSHQGKLRHLSLRIGRRTGEILLTLVSTNYQLENLEKQAAIWLERYPLLVGVNVNYNPHKGNSIFGSQNRTIAGRGYLREIFANLEFHLRPETFFQVNTETAEALLSTIIEKLQLKGHEIVLDAYCGIGTFTLPLAKLVKQVIGIEVQATAVEQACFNAQINNINNTTFIAGSVESLLPQLELNPDIVILDPPRAGCDRFLLETLMMIRPKRIVYISCQPASLARDLKILCQNNFYKLLALQAADFFPQTSHVECIAFLES